MGNVDGLHAGIRSDSEVALFSHEAGRHFILNFEIYCSFQSSKQVCFNLFVLFGNCE